MDKVKTFMATVATVAVVGAGQVVQAEDVQPKEVKGTEAAQTKPVVTKEEVTQSQATVDTATAAVEAQSKSTNQAQKDVRTAENTVKTETTNVAQAEKVAQEATPENVAKAETSVKETTNQVSQAENAVSASQTAQQTAQSEVTKQTETVAKAQETVTQKQADVAQAEKKVAEKQAILDGTGTKEILAKAEQTQAKVNADKEVVAKAQTDLAKAKQDDQKRTSDLAEAEKVVTQSQKAVTTSKADVDQKVAMANKTAEALEKATADLTKANQDVEAINQIKLTQEYIAALRDYAQKIATVSPAEEKAMTDKLVALGKVLAKQNRFKANKNDSEEKLDLNNLSEATREELSLFAADLLNQIHAAFGTSKVEVTKDVTKIINDHVSTSKTNGVKGHDTEHLNKLLAQYNITSSETDENIGLNGGSGIYSAKQFVTKTELKRLIYNAVVNMMFNASEDYEINENNEFLHASSMVGLFAPEAKTSYLGVGTSYKDDFWQVVNFLFVHDKALTNSTFNRTALANPFDSQELLNTQKEAQSTYDVVKQDDDRAQADKSKAEADYNKATAHLTEATAQCDAIKAIGLKTPAAQTQLDQAQATLKADEAENKVAQEAVAQLNADVKAKQAALAQAKAELAQQQSELNALKNSLSDEQNKLATKKADLAKAQALVSQRENELVQAKARLIAAQEKVRQLKDAPARLAQAKQNLLTAKQTLAEKKGLLEKEEAKLQVLKATQAEVVAQHAKLVKTYQAQLEAERLAKLAAQKVAIEQAGGEAIPVVDETGKITSYVDGKKQAVTPTLTPINHKQVKVNYNVSTNHLPSTGETTSLLGLFGGVILLVLSFVSRKRVK
ncbi:SEC10/PgrA surface exclusion domain-containing protein [Streptococcus anginosus]|nr:SEC10/PgrA surface exclusion domain-containing protein [Streptococcus anginosus]KAA9311675.1 SEC10/PgrA surface exclusion domain-containing protein [Streptococcus anginosus]MED5922484.1 SEC10/PgrA surface exclusion domain-containing protein [Streptococcus anginosus]MED5940979.1 SEC10/PgrA surface exclusion domain-containing protein [Streptococcus anginosus]MED5942729.1 SEC10/PgrA surface exclusion domain-containing protein [Streptococcus anginosus]MED5954657.1 SEC10/PgrA surface exclusion d